jgi:isoleucyl-tRNA synthetase
MNDELLGRFDVLSTLRTEAYRAIEKCRGEGLFKKPLDAQVTIYAPENVVEIIQRTEADGSSLAEFLIVSGAQVRGGRAAEAVTLSTDELGGVDFVIGLAEGSKCPRCWHVEATVGQDEEHPELCSRCVAAVTGVPEP